MGKNHPERWYPAVCLEWQVIYIHGYTVNIQIKGFICVSFFPLMMIEIGSNNFGIARLRQNC